MADTDSNTRSSYQSLPDCASLYSAMSAALAYLDFSNINESERSQVAEYCAEIRAGLCHYLNFIGDIMQGIPLLISVPDNRFLFWRVVNSSSSFHGNVPLD
nr:hypothetical protein [Serratia plymuthica]